MSDTTAVPTLDPRQDTDADHFTLEGIQSDEHMPERFTVRIIFRNGAEIGVTGTRFVFQRHTISGKIVAWEFQGIDHQLGFDPTEILAWEVVDRERVSGEGDGVAGGSGS